MKITAVETIRLGEFPNLLWVHIHTDQGLIGLGETFFGPARSRRKSTKQWRRYCSASPRCRWTAMHGRCRTVLGFSGSGVEMRAASAVDIALWDLFGQATGQPLHQCLGGLSHDKVRIYNTCAGYRYIRSARRAEDRKLGRRCRRRSGPYEDLEAFLHRADELAHSLLEQGITAMKIWPFDFAAEATRGASSPLPTSTTP